MRLIRETDNITIQTPGFQALRLLEYCVLRRICMPYSKPGSIEDKALASHWTMPLSRVVECSCDEMPRSQTGIPRFEAGNAML